MVKRRSVYSTRQSPAFVVPAERVEEGEESGLPRIVKNQIVIRGAPVIARSLTSVGAAAMAAGIAIRSQPVTQKKFLHIKSSTRKDRLKLQYGKDWKRAWRAEKASTVHYRSHMWSPQIDVQEQRVKARNRRLKARRGVMLRGAGSVAMVSGQLVPLLAYGYVASSYLDVRQGLRTGKPLVDTEAILQDVAYLRATQALAVDALMLQAQVAMNVGRMAVGVVKHD